jgi:hypothetical protein
MLVRLALKVTQALKAHKDPKAPKESQDQEHRVTLALKVILEFRGRRVFKAAKATLEPKATQVLKGC